MATLYRPEAADLPAGRGARRRPAAVPSPAVVLGRALTDVVRKPTRLTRLQIRSLRASAS